MREPVCLAWEGALACTCFDGAVPAHDTTQHSERESHASPHREDQQDRRERESCSRAVSNGDGVQERPATKGGQHESESRHEYVPSPLLAAELLVKMGTHIS